jgi:hypothetical protein
MKYNAEFEQQIRIFQMPQHAYLDTEFVSNVPPISETALRFECSQASLLCPSATSSL